MSLLDDRTAKDAAFAHDPGSPLTDEQRAHFSGLAYFDIDPAYRFDLAIAPEAGEPILLAMSGGAPDQVYLPRARVGFTIAGTALALTLYQGESTGPLDYFVPFRDATSGTESYGGGRYLELTADRHGRVIVDFNEAYNPFCAYNDAWACPLPPRDNWLSVAIRAGERAFAGHA